MPGKGHPQIYALYRGDDFIDVGTATEIGKRQGMTPKSLRFLASPAYWRRLDGKGEHALLAIKLEEDSDETNH